MIRNYAKQSVGLFTRTAAKTGALTILQFINYSNDSCIGEVKYVMIEFNRRIFYL